MLCGLSKGEAGIRFTMLNQVERRRITLVVVSWVCTLDDDYSARDPG
jgi:hypothetical protein